MRTCVCLVANILWRQAKIPTTIWSQTRLMITKLLLGWNLELCSARFKVMTPWLISLTSEICLSDSETIWPTCPLRPCWDHISCGWYRYGSLPLDDSVTFPTSPRLAACYTIYITVFIQNTHTKLKFELKVGPELIFSFSHVLRRPRE